MLFRNDFLSFVYIHLFYIYISRLVILIDYLFFEFFEFSYINSLKSSIFLQKLLVFLTLNYRINILCILDKMNNIIYICIYYNIQIRLNFNHMYDF